MKSYLCCSRLRSEEEEVSSKEFDARLGRPEFYMDLAEERQLFKSFRRVPNSDFSGMIECPFDDAGIISIVNREGEGSKNKTTVLFF